MADKTAVIPSRLFIDGDWREGSGGTIADINPSDEQLIIEVSAGSPTDIDDAVSSARHALDGVWAGTPGAARGEILSRIADLIERDAEILARLEALDGGKPVGQPLAADIPMAVATFRHFAGWADKITGSTIPTSGYMGRPTHSFTVREPVGVIGAIVPWNAPLMITAWKVAPALAAGNTVVVKAAEDAPLSVLHLVALFSEAGLPDGVVNAVPGVGDVAGAALVAHPGVDKITFTGSPEVGREVLVSAAQTFKRVTLELGGKSPHIVFADADVESAINGIALGLFSNQGQVCAAGSRIIAHRSLHDRVVDGLAAIAKAQVLGDPFASTTTMGPLISAVHRDRVEGYIESGRAQGASVVVGGSRPDRPGFFVQPTIFTDVDNEMRIAQEEIFGPVGAVIAFEEPEEAIEIANATEYGLSATLWTRDVSRAHLSARSVRAGAVWVNGWGATAPALPWGGIKTSGIGRELGWSAIEACTEEKTIAIVL